MTVNIERFAIVICVVIAIIALVAPQTLITLIQPIIQQSISSIGGAFFLFINGLFLALLLLCVSPLGAKKMGGEHSKVEFSTFGWLSMLFAAGMGSGLIFWGVAEPAIHYTDTPLKQSFYPDKLGASMALTMLNWGVHAWALYAAFGVLLGGITKAISKPEELSAPVLFGLGKWPGQSVSQSVHNGICLVAIIAIFFGVVGTIANASMLLKNGMQQALNNIGFSIDTIWLALVILSCITGLYFVSTRLGLKKGIQSLSKFNVYLTLIMMFLVISSVPLEPILSTFTSAIAEYTMLVISGAWQLDSQLVDANWANGWTYNYYFWWLAWGPFVGVFLARISRGRTLRQYILAVVFIPTLLTLVWFSVFGGSAIAIAQHLPTDLLSVIANDYTQGVYFFFSHLGTMGEVLTLLSFVLLVVFVATSADSALLVIKQLCAPSSAKGSIFIWSVLMAIISLCLVLISDETLNRNIAVIGALPFVVIFVFQIVGFVKALVSEMSEEDDKKAP
ncbi:BCCT family transporter [Pseudoalteromonas sp. SSDWG2]|uniref:BCCT family transporter n=1 Tax=Pseudoalteromonas sp. SSDWG2 TaxID=3139391 RepID=UPI003BAAE989